MHLFTCCVAIIVKWLESCSYVFFVSCCHLGLECERLEAADVVVRVLVFERLVLEQREETLRPVERTQVIGRCLLSALAKRINKRDNISTKHTTTTKN